MIAALGAALWSASYAEPGWLGVRVSDAPSEHGGAALLGVIARQSPAEQAGLQHGDVVRAAGARRIRRARDLIQAVGRQRPRGAMRLEIVRGGAAFSIDVPLASRPAGFERLFEYERDAWQEPGRVLDAIGIRPGATVADLGAGGGYFTERLAERVGPAGRVIAIDIDAAALHALARRFPQAQFPNVRIQRGRASDPALEPNSVDAILVVDTYHEFANPPAMLAALRRALRRDGRLAVVDWPTAEWSAGAHAIPERRVREELSAAGFREIGTSALPRQFLLVYARTDDAP